MAPSNVVEQAKRNCCYFFQNIRLQVHSYTHSTDAECVRKFVHAILEVCTNDDHRSDIGDVKDAIHTFLESKNEHRDMWERRRETMERYRKSTATSFYSVNRAPSYPSSSVCASSGSSFRSRTGSMIFWEPASRDASEPLISPFGDDVTCNGSGNSNLGSSAGSSSSILPLLPPTNLESIQIPPSLLGLDTVDAEQFWSRLAPDLPTASPAPYSTFKERYLNIGPYLWLHGRVWHGDRATSGTLLVTRYSPRSGEIELSRVLLNPPNHESGKTERSWLPPGNDFNRTPEYREAEPTISLESAILGLKIRHHSTYHDGRNVRGPYSFHHISPMSPEQQSSSKESTIWPPIIFPAEDRTTRSLSQQPRPPGDSPRYSLNLFELRKTARGLDRLTGSNIELFSALGPELYTPDIENPLRGIWYWRAFTGYEFMLLRQNSRNQVVGLKLTGSTYIARGARGFGVENTQESGELHGKCSRHSRSRFSSPDRTTYTIDNSN